MTPKEKAKELYNKFFREVPFSTLEDDERDDCIAAKQCALIAVDEIIYALKNNAANSASYIYYEEVKQEIVNI